MIYVFHSAYRQFNCPVKNESYLSRVRVLGEIRIFFKLHKYQLMACSLRQICLDAINRYIGFRQTSDWFRKYVFHFCPFIATGSPAWRERGGFAKAKTVTHSVFYKPKSSLISTT